MRLHPTIQAWIKEGRLTRQQLVNLTPCAQDVLIHPQFSTLFLEGELTVDDFVGIDGIKLVAVFYTKGVFELIATKKLTMKQVLGLTEAAHASLGKKEIRELIVSGALTAEHLAAIRTNAAGKALYYCIEVRELIIKGILTPEHLAAIKTDAAGYVLRDPAVLELIVKGVLTPEHLAAIETDKVGCFLRNPHVLESIAQGMLAAEDLSSIVTDSVYIPLYDRCNPVLEGDLAKFVPQTLQDEQVKKMLSEGFLDIVIKDAVIKYLERFASPKTADEFKRCSRLMERVRKNGLKEIWEKIQGEVAIRMHKKFGMDKEIGYLYMFKVEQYHIIVSLVDTGYFDYCLDLSLFHKQIERSKGYQQFCGKALRCSGIFPSQRLDQEFIIANRHHGPDCQSQYDKRFGIVPVSNG